MQVMAPPGGSLTNRPPLTRFRVWHREGTELSPPGRSKHLARYFFHLRHRSDQLLDREGVELVGVAAARAAALNAARDTLSHDMRSGALDLRYRIDVEDEAGAEVYSIALRDAFTIIEG